MVSSSIKALGLFATMAVAQSSVSNTTFATLPSSVVPTSTVYDTVVYTISSCAPTVTDCPYGRVTSSVVPAAATTVYTTEYVDVCPTGLVTSTYTVTQACGLAKCQIPAPTVVPQGFAILTKVCAACAGQPTLTVTCPVAAPTGGPYTNGTVTIVTPPVVTVPAVCNGANCPPPVVVTVPAAACNGANCPPAATGATIVAGCNGSSCPTNTPVVVTAGAKGMVSSGHEAVVAGLLSVVAVMALAL